jgi:hypothetical protein
MSWLREVFSEDGQGSFSRVAAAFHTSSVLAWGFQYVHFHHIIPDPVTLTALSAFAVAPYAANKAASAISSLSNRTSVDPSK